MTKKDKYDGYLFVRIHPYNPVRGYLTRRYHDGEFLYREDCGWKKVTKSKGKELAKILTNPSNPLSAPVFGVYTFEEARDIEIAENYEKDPRKLVEDAAAETVGSAGDLTTADLRRPPDTYNEPKPKRTVKGKKRRLRRRKPAK